MSKKIYCAKCGKELHFALKALPKQQLTVTVVEPHKCSKDTAKNPYKDSNEELLLKPKRDVKEINKMFEDFEFSKELGGKDSIPTTTIFDDNSGDKRSKDIIREDNTEVNSLAPPGILNGVKSSPNSVPENELKE